MKKNSYYSNEELLNFGFKSLGKNVLISRNARFYNCEKIEIGNNVRIDDFCVLSGKIILKNYIHISLGVSLIAGDAGIEIGNHCCVSVKCSIFAITDNFNGDFLVGPLEKLDKRNVIEQKIILEDYVVVGCNTVLLPGAYLSIGVAVGALSLVKSRLEPFSIYGGCPCRFIRKRSRKMTEI